MESERQEAIMRCTRGLERVARTLNPLAPILYLVAVLGFIVAFIFADANHAGWLAGLFAIVGFAILHVVFIPRGDRAGSSLAATSPPSMRACITVFIPLYILLAITLAVALSFSSAVADVRPSEITART